MTSSRDRVVSGKILYVLQHPSSGAKPGDEVIHEKDNLVVHISSWYQLHVHVQLVHQNVRTTHFPGKVTAVSCKSPTSPCRVWSCVSPSVAGGHPAPVSGDPLVDAMSPPASHGNPVAPAHSVGD